MITETNTLEAALAALQDPSVTELKLGGINLLVHGAAEIAKALPSSAVTFLDLSGTNLQNDAMTIVAQGLPGSAVKKLSLGYNQMGDGGLIALAAVLPQTQITDLEFGVNRIGAAGAIALAEALPATALTRLDISNNVIGDAGARAFGKAIAASSLSELIIYSNRITVDGAKVLASGLSGSLLRRLHMGSDDMGEESIQAFADTVPHSAVTQCGLWGHAWSAPEVIANSPDLVNAARARALCGMLENKAAITPEILPDLERLCPSLEHEHNAAQNAAKRRSSLRTYIKDLLPQAADAAMAKGLDVTRLILRAMPLDSALSWLSDRGVVLKATDFLNEDGSIPQDRFVCQGGFKALFTKPELWESTRQVKTALASLPDVQRRGIPNTHSLLAQVRRDEREAEPIR